MQIKTSSSTSFKKIQMQFPVSVLLSLKHYNKNQVKLPGMSCTLEEMKILEFPTPNITAFCYTFNMEIMSKNTYNK